MPRPMPTRIAGSPNSSGIICADIYRSLQPGLNRRWRAMGTRGSVYRCRQLALTRGWRAMGTRGSVYRCRQLALTRGWRAMGTRGSVYRCRQLALTRGWRAMGTRGSVYRCRQLALTRGWRAMGTRGSVYRWRQPGSNRGWRAMGTRGSVYRCRQLALTRGWRAMGTRGTVDARAPSDARGEQGMDLGLRGKVALVASASKGLGKACALGLAAEGACVAMGARPEGDIKTAAEEGRAKTGAEVLGMAADATKADDVKSIVARTKQTFGGIDVLVANCGGPP